MDLQPVTPEKALDVARRAAVHLAALVHPDGRFTYRYVLPDPSVTDGAYNKARHIVALSGLLEAERYCGPLEGVREAALRAGDFMRRSILEPFDGSGSLCVVEGHLAMLGPSALGVVAALGLQRLTGDDAWLDTAKRVGRYLLSQRREDGDFVHLRNHPLLTIFPRRSQFFSAQALLALGSLAMATGDLAWSDPALGSMRRLANGAAEQQAAQWTLYALEGLHAVSEEPWLADYGARVAGKLVADPEYRKIRESTPVACATEGLLAYLRIAGASSPLANAALKNVRQNLRQQLRYFHPSGAFVHSIERHEVRIDYIQHNLAGFLGYWRLQHFPEDGATRS